MAITAKSLADGTLSASKATLYTTPAATKAYVKFFSLHNTNVNTQTVKIYIKRASSSSRLVDYGELLQNETGIIVDEGSWELAAGDLIEGETTDSGVVDFLIAGAEET